MAINKFKNRTYSWNKKPSYLRYDDVFISRSNSNNNRNYPQNAKEEYEEEYFSKDENGENNILHERMMKYQKRQLPPLQMYKSPMNSREMYNDYYEQPTYWDGGQENLYGPNRYQYKNDGAVFKSIWHKFFMTFIAILLLICVAWIAYNCGNKGDSFSSRHGPVFIEPETQDFKVLPENPGGFDVPHKDKIVYSRISGNAADEEQSESLLPPQEKASIAQPEINIDEYSIVDEKMYYIKVSSNRSREVLENGLNKVSKKYSNKVGDMPFSIKSVRDKNGNRQYALLIGPASSKIHAINTAKELNTDCSVIAVRE
jgi:cbb3-type cytochrome oxidase subunit 3